MASGQRSLWPFVLLVGVCVSLLLGGAVAVAAPSDTGRPWWHERGPQRVTGTVLAVDRSAGTVELDGLVSYDPVQAGLGTLTISVADLPAVQVDDTVDVDVVRHDGGWTADGLIVLDTD
ncbi:MAG: hypothetical protein JWO68_90 [Actinomycetia bacterium]|nr:hypothetical protein [Actinomycetes bacterium]